MARVKVAHKANFDPRTISLLPADVEENLEEYKENPALTNILGLLRITLVIPVQTATLERGFSLMKRIKTDWRNRLSPQTLSQLMMIKLDGPGLDQFNSEPADGGEKAQGLVDLVA